MCRAMRLWSGNKGRAPRLPDRGAWPAARDWGLAGRGSFGCEPRTGIQLFSVSSPGGLSSMSLLHAGHIVGPYRDCPISLRISDSNHGGGGGGSHRVSMAAKTGHQPTTHSGCALGLTAATGSPGHRCGHRWTRGSTSSCASFDKEPVGGPGVAALPRVVAQRPDGVSFSVAVDVPK